ncbi:hypothetical protein O3M35_001972 [Rhynocoris fuscipes]|uniref:Reverse transcriptase n=1 Tax=Rhynocoris fuscipes TaxID=488301 RepID=A0AAW1CT21_9HEMI
MVPECIVVWYIYVKMYSGGNINCDEKSFEVGQSVWVLRTGGACQKATIASIMSVSGPGGREPVLKASVEWFDETGEFKGKTVPIEDLFPSDPRNIAAVTAPDTSDVKEATPSDSLDIPVVVADTLSHATPCKICGLSFKNQKGLRIHIAKKHPAEANRLKLSSILQSDEPSDSPEPPDFDIKTEIDRFADNFKAILNVQGEYSADEFDETVSKFLAFLRTANQSLPGPKHPAVRHYLQRRKNKFKMPSKGNSQVSNPARANKATRDRRKEAFRYELAQYYYYNRRKKVVNTVMNADAPQHCPINMQDIEAHFGQLFEQPNCSLRTTYDFSRANPDISTLPLHLFHKAIKSTSLDTSPGPDGVLIRTIKALDVAHVIQYIAEIMLKTSYVPSAFRKGRTVLIYKGKGAISNISAWRPITIYSIVRRIIEKVFDAELRKQVAFHKCQRGFVRGLPGCHVNARLIDAILKDAKQCKKDAVISFLDVTGAFDNIGHDHILRSLEGCGVSSDLSKAISALTTANLINI